MGFIYLYFLKSGYFVFFGGKKGRRFHHFRSLCYERLFFSTWSSFNSARKGFILCKIKRMNATCQAQVASPKLLDKQPEKPPIHFLQMASCKLNDSSQGCRYPQLCSTGPWQSMSRGRRMRSLLRARGYMCNTTGTSLLQPKCCLVTSVMVTWKSLWISKVDLLIWMYHCPFQPWAGPTICLLPICNPGLLVV